MPRTRQYQCECGCEKVLHARRMTYAKTEDGSVYLVTLECHEPFLRERRKLQSLMKLMRARPSTSIYGRFCRRKEVHTLTLECGRRIRGDERAEREAKRSATLYWLPNWLGELIVPYLDARVSGLGVIDSLTKVSKGRAR